jgi:subtilisin family serine protease
MPRLVIIPAVLLLSLLLVVASDLRPRGGRGISVDLDSPAAEHEVLIHLSNEGFALSDASLGQRLRGEVTARLPEIGVVRLRLAEGETVAQAVERLSRNDLVRWAEPNHLLRATLAPNDPFYTAQSSYLELIEAPAAWDIEQGNPDVIVAVLDSGIDLEHPDLEGKAWLNAQEIPGDKLDNDANGCVDDVNGCNFVSPATASESCPPQSSGNIVDDNGHGTFVSGIIAARGNNGVGVTGVAPGVTILPVKILDCQGGGTAAEAAQAVLYAARMGARVANISFGADGESITLASAIREAHDLYAMVIVAATGNEGEDRVTFPARLRHTLAVGSSGSAADPTARSAFSDWGPEVAFVAPGLNIVSTVPPLFCETAWLCVEDKPYAVASGTSFAAPLVSGLAALLISRNPNLSPDTVRQMIAATAQPLPDGSTPLWDGAGRIRMRTALNLPRYYLGASGVGRQ